MPHKESRKIIAVGNTSVGIILPKAWIDFYGLKKGDYVEVISNGIVRIIPMKR